ncbi:MAG: hemin uptake protein HemP [Burkholderiaceae bacterium]|nr:hemin uptake protein HemP [Burkholderiaceae bacterium]
MPQLNRTSAMPGPACGATDVASPAQPPGGRPGESPLLLRSTDLMQGRRIVNIEHNGHLYRLQTTKQGKLILTK